MGVQLVLKDGTKILIGSRRREELAEAIKKVMESNLTTARGNLEWAAQTVTSGVSVTEVCQYEQR